MKHLTTLFTFMYAFQVTGFPQSFQSPHFKIQKLGEGVYAAIATNGGHAICNAGIIDMDEYTLIFDPFMTPEAAEDLKKTAQELTGHPVKYVVDSHYHNDHIGGNQVFTDASIISTSRTRELIAKFQPEEIEFGKSGASAVLEKYKSKDESLMKDHELEEHSMWKGYFEAYVTSANELTLDLPDIVFNDHLTIYGSKRNVELITYGEGHTESDLFLYLPDDHIAFLGDLLFINNQPWTGDGDPIKWTSYLSQISHLDIKWIVPGHGPVGTLADITPMEGYFQNVEDAARSFHEKGISPDTIQKINSPPPYDSWFLSNFYKSNVISEYHRIFPK